ncbi:MAG: helix-turn-helix domain-containing protein [bacterium]
MKQGRVNGRNVERDLVNTIGHIRPFFYPLEKEVKKMINEHLGEIIPDIKEVKIKAEQKYIITILNTVNWHISEAARIMGINRSTLFRKMKKYRISRKSKTG